MMLLKILSNMILDISNHATSLGNIPQLLHPYHKQILPDVQSKSVFQFNTVVPHPEPW